MSTRRYGPFEMATVPEGGLVYYWWNGELFSRAGRVVLTGTLDECAEIVTKSGGVVRQGLPPGGTA